MHAASSGGPDCAFYMASGSCYVVCSLAPWIWYSIASTGPTSTPVMPQTETVALCTVNSSSSSSSSSQFCTPGRVCVVRLPIAGANGEDIVVWSQDVTVTMANG